MGRHNFLLCTQNCLRIVITSSYKSVCRSEGFKLHRHVKETLSLNTSSSRNPQRKAPLLYWRVCVCVCTTNHSLPFSHCLMTLLVDLLMACNTTGFSWSTCDLPSCKCHPQWKVAPKLGCFDYCLASLTWLVRAEPSRLPWNKLLKPVPSKASVNSWRSWLFTLQDRYAIKLWQKGLPDH